jgi:hypothetical protein
MTPPRAVTWAMSERSRAPMACAVMAKAFHQQLEPEKEIDRVRHGRGAHPSASRNPEARNRLFYIDSTTERESASALANPHLSAHGVKQSLRVVPHAVLKHDCHILDLFDMRGRISLHEYEIRALTLRDGADVVLPS